MAERIVDVLEVVEIDVKHGGRRTAGPHLADHGFQPLAEIDAVGQAADRVVHREMPQLRFAVGHRFGGAAHVAHHQTDQQREAGERHDDERDHAQHDLAAGRRRLPGEARDRIAPGVGNFSDIVAGGRRRADLVQIQKLQVAADLAQHGVVDIFDGENDRRLCIAGSQIGIAPDRHRGDNRRPTEKMLDQRCGRSGMLRILGGEHVKRAGRQRGEMAAQQTEAGRDVRSAVGTRGQSMCERELMNLSWSVPSTTATTSWLK